MIPFKLHKTFVYILSLILPQLVLGWLFYNAFDSPEGNTFHFTNLAIAWISLIFLFLGLIALEITQKISGWILPCAIICCYTVFLSFLSESSIFIDIPRIKSTSINYEIIPLYLTIPTIFHAILDLIFKYFKPDGTLASNMKNFGFSILIPVCIYGFTVLCIPLFSNKVVWNLNLNWFTMQIMICIAVAAFLFFFCAL